MKNEEKKRLVGIGISKRGEKGFRIRTDDIPEIKPVDAIISPAVINGELETNARS